MVYVRHGLTKGFLEELDVLKGGWRRIKNPEKEGHSSKLRG